MDVDPEDLGYDPSTVAVPFEELLEEATRNKLPPRTRKRGQPTPSALLAMQASSSGGVSLDAAAAAAEPEKEKAGVDA